jgi:hypothetical protein
MGSGKREPDYSINTNVTNAEHVEEKRRKAFEKKEDGMSEEQYKASLVDEYGETKWAEGVIDGLTKKREQESKRKDKAKTKK